MHCQYTHLTHKTTTEQFSDMLQHIWIWWLTLRMQGRPFFESVWDPSTRVRRCWSLAPSGCRYRSPIKNYWTPAGCQVHCYMLGSRNDFWSFWWWHIPALVRQRQAGLCKSEASQSYIVRAYLKIKQQNKICFCKYSTKLYSQEQVLWNVSEVFKKKDKYSNECWVVWV